MKKLIATLLISGFAGVMGMGCMAAAPEADEPLLTPQLAATPVDDSAEVCDLTSDPDDEEATLAAAGVTRCAQVCSLSHIGMGYMNCLTACTTARRLARCLKLPFSPCEWAWNQCGVWFHTDEQISACVMAVDVICLGE